jgi:transcriptional regulator with XRE-family HTH domain/tetratricopeptide (TPR) repeat protein
MPQSPTGASRSLDPRSPEAQFGMRLRKAREQRGISLREMARRLSRAHSNLWDYERGHRLATPDVVAEYESELRMPPGELQTPLEEVRREVFGADRHRRRPFRPPAPQLPQPPTEAFSPPRRLPTAWTATRPLGPFIGRDQESATVRSWLDEAEAGEPRIVVVRGPAGIGKSTLLAHVLGGIGPDRWTVLRASCLQGARIAYLPVATALSPLLNAMDRQTEPATPGGMLELLLGEPEPLAEAGSAAGTESVLSLDRRHLSLFFAATKLVLDAAIQRPVILAIEDLHWADGSTLGLLEHLSTIATQESALTPTPLAIVLTTRAVTTEDPTWRVLQRISRESTFRELTLTGLDDFEVTELVTELGQARPSPRLLRSVSTASQGNPLLVRSLIDRLISDGRISVRDRMLGGEDDDLPVDALDLDAELAVRLERIDRPSHEVITRAAVLGDGGSLVALQAATTASDVEFDRMLVGLAEARLLYEIGDTYRFDHPQLREVLYASLPQRRRRRLHLEIASRLEAQFPDDGREVVAIAHHLDMAGPVAPPDKLAKYARAAAEQAWDMAAWGDAGRYYDVCIGTDPDGADDADLLWRAGVSHFRNHDVEGAEKRLAQAVAAARSAGDTRALGAAALALTRSRLILGSLLGKELDVQLLQDFVNQGDDQISDLRARAYALMAEARFSNFDVDAGLEYAKRALVEASEGTDDEVRSEVEVILGVQLLLRLELDEAERRLRLGQQCAERLPDPWARSWGASRLPLIHLCRGDLERADRNAIDAVGLAADHFDWAESSLSIACRAAVAVAQGRTAEAESLGSLAHQQYLRSDYQWTVVVLAPALAACRAYQADAAGAEEAVEMLAAAGVGRRRTALAVQSILGDEVAVRSVLAGRRVRPPASGPYNLFDLAAAACDVEVCELVGDTRLAEAAVGPLEAARDAGFAHVLGWSASVPRLLGVAYLRLGRVDEAHNSLKKAVEEAIRAPAPAEEGRARLNLAEALMAKGEMPTATAELEQAQGIFAAYGLSALAARVEQLKSAIPSQCG